MLQFFKRSAGTVANAAANRVRLFVDVDGLHKTKDETGQTVVLGNGIESITLVGTSGLNKTYRITRQDGATFDYTVADGRGITSLALLGTAGLVDTYRVTFNDLTTFDFTVTNARSIVDVAPPVTPGQPGATDTYTIQFNDGPSETFIVYNGVNGLNGQGTPANAPPPAVASTSSTGTATAEYALEDHTHAGVTSVSVNGGAAQQGAVSVTVPVAANAAPPAVAATGSAGTSTGEYANENHTHAGVTSVSVNGGATQQGAVSVTVPTAANAAPPAVASASSTGTSTGEYALEDHTHAGVTSFNGRQGAVAPQQADYDAFFTTPAEAAAAAPVQSVSAGTGISVNATTGAVTVTNADRGSTAVSTHEAAGDPHPQYTTAAEAAAAAPVQSVAGKSGAVTLNGADVGLGNVKNPAVASVHSTAPQTLNQTLTALATMTIPANSLQAGDAFEIDVLFATLVNTTAASNLEVAVFINGTQNALATAAMGTTAVAAPGRGGRALMKVVFRSVGAAGTALANGTIHVNNLANFASNQVTVQTVNTTAAITLDVRARTSAATTTGTVQFAAIEQAT